MRQSIEAMRQQRTAEQMAPATAIAEQQAARDACSARSPICGGVGRTEPEVQQRSHDLDQTAHSWMRPARDQPGAARHRGARAVPQDGGHQIANSTRPQTIPLGPSAAGAENRQCWTNSGVKTPICSDRSRNSHGLDTARAETSRLQQDIDSRNQLRKTQEQQIATAASARPSDAAIAEQQAAQDTMRRQIADLQQQVAQRSQALDAAHAETGKLRQDIDALNQLRNTQEQQIAAAASARPSAAAIAEQQAAQDAQRRQIADLQQQVAQRSNDLDAAHAETSRLRRDIDALNQLRKTKEQQIAAAASARPPAPGPSAAAVAEQQAAQDALRRQVAELQQQVAQRSHDLDLAHAETGKLRQDIDALNQLRKTQEQPLATAAPARPSAPGPSAAAVAEQQDAQRRQIADLQQQVAQRSRDLRSARGETVKLREGLDALHQQRRLEDAAATRQKAQEQQMAAAAARPAVARPTSLPPLPMSAPPAASRATQPTSVLPTAPPGSAPPAAPPQPASPQLLTARQWLATGRPDEARRVLAMVQTRMVLQPVTPDSTGRGGRQSIRHRCRQCHPLAGHRRQRQAMQAIDRAIGNANAPVSAQPWSGYPPGAPGGYPQQGFATNGSGR